MWGHDMKQFLLILTLLFAPASFAQNAASTLLGCPSTGACAPGPIAIGSGLTMSGSTLSSSGTSPTPGTPVQGYDTPLNEGATGNGIANDTTPVQTCATTGNCYLPPGYTFLVSSSITIPDQGQFVGGGSGHGSTPTTGVSIIKGSSVSGPIIQVGTHASQTSQAVHVGNFEIEGTATEAMAVNGAYMSTFDRIMVYGVFSQAAFDFESSFCLNLDHLMSNTSTIGMTVTFTSSVGGAATGTISSTAYYASGGVSSGAATSNPPNYNYMMVFSDGEVRRVTVSGTTVTWTGNLAAGTITTGSIGTGFIFGAGGNCITANTLVANNGTAIPFGFVFEDIQGYGQTNSGNVFNAPTAEVCQVCLFLGAVTQDMVINSYYCEQCVLPILVGEAAGSYFAYKTTINGANMSGPISTNPGYANRSSFIDVQATYGFTIHSPLFQVSDGTAGNAYPLTFSGGTQTTAPKVYGFANAAGVMKGCAIVYPGDYGTGSTPTLTASYTGGNAGSGATFSITAGLTPFAQQGVTGCTVTAGGTGYTAGPGMVPVSINSPSGATAAVIIDAPVWGYGLSGNNSISQVLVYDSVNASGFNRMGLTVTNDSGEYNAENGGNLMGSTITHAPENNYREWVEYMGAGGIPGTYQVPLVAFP
jgi:hypothetical protein